MTSTNPNTSFNYALNNWVPIFDGENYQIWSVQIRTLLKGQGLWDVITKGYEIPPQDSKGKKSCDEDKQKQYEENQRRDCNALSLIQRGVTPSIFPGIMVADTARLRRLGRYWGKLIKAQER